MDSANVMRSPRLSESPAVDLHAEKCFADETSIAIICCHENSCRSPCALLCHDLRGAVCLANPSQFSNPRQFAGTHQFADSRQFTRVRQRNSVQRFIRKMGKRR